MVGLSWTATSHEHRVYPPLEKSPIFTLALSSIEMRKTLVGRSPLMRGLDVIEDVIGLGDFLERLKPVMCLAALRMTASNSDNTTAHSIGLGTYVCATQIPPY